MSGLFGIINLGLSALRSQRSALNVTSHNLANATTPGYSRQSAVLSQNPPLPPAGTSEALVGGQYGTGVRVVSFYRAREGFLSTQARIAQGYLGRHGAAASALREAEAALAPAPGEDISALLDRFWDAWDDVANEPADLGLRHVLRGAGDVLAATFRNQVERLNSIRQAMNTGIRARVEEVNELASQIAEYNCRIAVARAEDRSPNDLLDARDRLLGRFAELTGALPAHSEAGHLSVYLDGRPVMQGASFWPVSLSSGAGGMEIVSGYDGAVVDVARGEIGGMLYARDTAIPMYLSELDSLARTLVAEVNARHQNGYGLDGVTGRAFFAAGSGAADIALDPTVAADVQTVGAGASDAPGDGEVALSIARLRTTAVSGGRTLGELGHLLLGMVGDDLRNCDDGGAAQEFALEQIREQEQSVSGVSVDEEIAHMTLCQRAYEAAARVVTAADEMIAIVLERLGA